MSVPFAGATEDRRQRLDIAGDILSTSSESIRQQLTVCLDAAGPSAIGVFDLNLRATRMVDSVGLNLLVWLIKQVNERGGKLRIWVADPNLLRVFQFTRLDRHAEVIRAPG